MDVLKDIKMKIDYSKVAETVFDNFPSLRYEEPELQAERIEFLLSNYSRYEVIIIMIEVMKLFAEQARSDAFTEGY